jgi:hypothetical protein
MSNNPLREIWRNFTAPDQHPIFVCIGEDVEIDDLRAQEPSPELHAAEADRCMAAVARTAEAHRRGPTDLPRARPVRRPDSSRPFSRNAWEARPPHAAWRKRGRGLWWWAMWTTENPP